MLGPPLGLALWIGLLQGELGDPTGMDFWGQTAIWFTLCPFVLAAFIVVYRYFPYPEGRLGTAPQGQRPRAWREGNPAIRQPSGMATWVAILILASFGGCTSMLMTNLPGQNVFELGLPLMYVSLAMIFFMRMCQAHWIELDIDSLRIIRHRVIRGLQTSEVHSEHESVRALGVCRGSFGGPYKIFAFSRNGLAVPLSQEQVDLKEIQFEAERLADQLMVPLLRSVENQTPDSVARHLRSLSDEKLPVRHDWAPVTVPAAVASHRSTYPPVD